MSSGLSLKRFDYSDRAFSLSGFLSREGCREWIERGEALGFEPAPVHVTGGTAMRADLRNNERINIHDPEQAENLWRLLAPQVSQSVVNGWLACGLNPEFRLYRYERLQQFKRHVDGKVEFGGQESRKTFMIYLNGDCEGGFTDFYDFKVWPEEGMTLVFDHALPHEGAMVTNGRKYVLRSDVMFRRE